MVEYGKYRDLAGPNDVENQVRKSSNHCAADIVMKNRT